MRALAAPALACLAGVLLSIAALSGLPLLGALLGAALAGLVAGLLADEPVVAGEAGLLGGAGGVAALLVLLVVAQRDPSLPWSALPAGVVVAQAALYAFVPAAVALLVSAVGQRSGPSPPRPGAPPR